MHGSRPLSLVLAALSAAPLAADTIYTTGGTPIEDCTVLEETVQSVIYKLEGKRNEDALPSDEVLEIVYKVRPELLEQAKSFYESGALVDAVDTFETYLASDLSREKQKWAPAFAARRVMELQDTLGNPDGVVKAADRLLERFPDSRYVPEAFLAKSRVLFEKGDKDKARKALEDLQKLVQEKGLSDRWRLECRLGLVLTDSALQGEERAKTLKDIERDANDFPTVKSRARVALAESLLQAGKVDEAESAFRELAAEGRADDAGLAAIYTGLGDCLYTKGANGGNPEALKQAALAYMRVVILYKDHARYASRAMFFAARSLDLQKGDQNLAAARKLYAAVVRDFGNSSYASDARSYLR